MSTPAIIFLTIWIAAAPALILCLRLHKYLKGTTWDEIKWFGAIAFALVIMAPSLVVEYFTQARKVKRQARVIKLSEKHITVTGDIVILRKGKAKIFS